MLAGALPRLALMRTAPLLLDRPSGLEAPRTRSAWSGVGLTCSLIVTIAALVGVLLLFTAPFIRLLCIPVACTTLPN